MSFCPKCGREIVDEAFGCPVCAFQKEELTEQTESQQPDNNQTEQNQPYQGGAGNANNNQPYQGGAGNTNNNQPYQGGAGNTNNNQPYQGGAGSTNNNRPYQGGAGNQNAQGTWAQNNNQNTTWNQAPYQNTPIQQTDYIQTPIRVMCIALIILTGGIGAIVSLVCGIVMMKNEIEEYRKFGQLITIVSTAMLALFFLCCVLGVFGNIIDTYMYF